MRSCRVSGRSYIANDLSLANLLPNRAGNLALMGIQGDSAAAVIDHNCIAVPTHPAGVNNLATIGSPNFCAVASTDISAGMTAYYAEDRMNSTT